MRLVLRFLACLLPLAASLDAAASDLYGTLNRLRAGAGGSVCARAANLPPLKVQPALERAAWNLSQGGDTAQSLKQAGYRAIRSRTISLKGEGVDAKAAGILAGAGYCPSLQDAGLTEAGIYLDDHQLWVLMAAPFAPAVAKMTGREAGQRVLDLVNVARARPRSCGNRAFKVASPVRWNDNLAEASRLHAMDMARHNYFSHGGRDGSDPAQRVERAGYHYRATGENIAAGTQMGPEDAVAGWIKSPGHCANLMNPAFTEMGAAFAIDARSDLGVYWAQAFGAPR